MGGCPSGGDSTAQKRSDDELVIAAAARKVCLSPALLASITKLKNESPNPDCRLQIGWPHASSTASPQLAPDRLFWFPTGFPVGRSVVIVSSRLGRDLGSPRLQPLFLAFRSACDGLDRDTHYLLTAAGTTLDSFVTRASFWFGLRVLRLHSSESTSLDNWVKSMRRRALRPADSRSRIHDAYVSPQLPGASTAQQTIENADHEPSSVPPLRDLLPTLAADSLLALNVRQGGNLHQLLIQRLAETPATADKSEPRIPRTRVALGAPCLVPPAVADQLLAAGGVGWLPLHRPEPQVVASESDAVSSGDVANATMRDVHRSAINTARIMDADELNQADYLTHCTRGWTGPAPGQDNAVYLDQLLWGEDVGSGTAVASLLRIIRMRRICASSRAIRGGTQVVSLTACRWDQLSTLRCFRSHRGRWDFEPYGVALQRAAVRRMGGRSVIYGDDSVWDGLPPDRRPWFQQRLGRGGKIDWSREQEWRVVGDIDLRQVCSQNAVVVVPTVDVARRVLPHSSWNVVVLPSSE